MLGHISYTAELGQVVPFDGKDPYILQTRKETCMIASVDTNSGIAHIDRMFVTPEDRTNGLGTQMLFNLCDRARELGLLQVTTIIDTDDPADQQHAIRWITKHGFVPVDHPDVELFALFL